MISISKKPTEATLAHHWNWSLSNRINLNSITAKQLTPLTRTDDEYLGTWINSLLIPHVIPYITKKLRRK